MIERFALSIEKIAIISGLAVALLFAAVLFVIVRKRLPRRLKKSYFRRKWVELQRLCNDKANWVQAITMGDELLDEALRRRSYKGKNMGERLVSAQRKFTDNDGVWFAHKLRSRLEVHPKTRLTRDVVKDALLGIGQALKDLEAL